VLNRPLAATAAAADTAAAAAAAALLLLLLQGAPTSASSCERLVSENQARMRDGPRSLRGGLLPPHVLQVGWGLLGFVGQVW
jgi:hypothetical protein